MILRLADVLTDAELDQLRAVAKNPDSFDDGKKTAGWAAKAAKANLQLKRGPRLDAAKKIVAAAMNRHPVFSSFALPKRFTSILMSRYEPGMAYGAHVDDALMGGERTDLSFTIFLSDPDGYDGGELAIHGLDGTDEIKLNPGEAVVYDTGLLHEVRPVTSGERLAAVGWVRSHVRGPDQRETLFDLDLAARSVFAKEEASETYHRIAKARANLIRMWAD